MSIAGVLFEKDIPFDFQFFSGNPALGHVFHLNIRSNEAKKANTFMIDYFKSWLD